jgi:O-antigen ligase
MIEIAIGLVVCIIIALRPTVIPYFSLSYLFLVGLASRDFVDKFKVSLGPVNILPLDLFYALAAIYAVIFFLKNVSNPSYNNFNASDTKITAILIFVLVLFFSGKLVNGIFNHMALDNVLRFFMTDTQVLYFFIPLVIYKDTNRLKPLLKFTVIISLVFPLCQPFLINSSETDFILKAQGTLRLGFGDANILLGFGCIALFCWEYKKYLTFLPLSGIMMLAHRSAYIAIALALIVVSLLKGKKANTLIMMVVAGSLVIGMLAVLQSFTNVNVLDKSISRASETFEATGTSTSRIGVFPIAIEELQKRPFTGLEYLEFRTALIKSEFSVRDFNLSHPHNFILASIINYGIIGSFLLFMLIVRSMRAAYILAKTKEFKTEGQYLFSSMLYFVVFSAMNTTMATVGYAFWFLCGVTFLLFNKYKIIGQQL